MNERSTPSTKTSGDDNPSVNEPTPRTYIVASSAPGCPVRCTVDNPGNLPVNALDILETGDLRISSVPTDEIAPVTVTFFVTPYATTCTSCNCKTSSDNSTFKVDSPL